MRKIIALLVTAIIISGASAQEDTTLYLKYPAAYGVAYPRQWATKILRTPFSDTSALNALPGAIQAGLDGKPYWWNGIKWIGISTADDLSAYVKYTDSLIRYVTPTQLADTAANIRTSLTQKVNIADSGTGYITPTNLNAYTWQRSLDATNGSKLTHRSEIFAQGNTLAFTGTNNGYDSFYLHQWGKVIINANFIQNNASQIDFNAPGGIYSNSPHQFNYNGLPFLFRNTDATLTNFQSIGYPGTPINSALINQVESSSDTIAHKAWVKTLTKQHCIVTFVIGQSNGGAQSPVVVPSFSPSVTGLPVYQLDSMQNVSQANDPVGRASNASPWPAYGLNMYKLTGVTQFIVNEAQPSTGVACQADLAGKGNWDTCGRLFDSAIARFVRDTTAISTAGYIIDKIVIIQAAGEYDALAINSGAMLQSDFIAAERKLIKRMHGYFSQAPIYINKVGFYNYPTLTGYAADSGFVYIQNAQDSILSKDSLIFSGTDIAPSFRQRGMMHTDFHHYNGTAYNEIGFNDAVNVASNIGLGWQTIIDSTNRHYIYANNKNVGINSYRPSIPLVVSPANSSDTIANILKNTSDLGMFASNGPLRLTALSASSNTSLSSAGLAGVRARGTLLNPTIVNNGDVGVFVGNDFYDGVQLQNTMKLYAKVTATPSAGNVPTGVFFDMGGSTASRTNYLNFDTSQLTYSGTGGIKIGRSGAKALVTWLRPSDGASWVTIGPSSTSTSTDWSIVNGSSNATTGFDVFITGGTKRFLQVAGGGTTGAVQIQSGGTYTRNAASLFDVASTTQGARPTPVMTAAQRDAIASAPAGLQVFNSDAGTVSTYTGSLWTNIAQNAIAAASATSGTFSQSLSNISALTITPTNNATINATGGLAGQNLTVIVTTSGTTSYTVTFGSNFKSTGTLSTGSVTAKVFTVSFIYDGTNWNEKGRTSAM